jgi:hypothetical protein
LAIVMFFIHLCIFFSSLCLIRWVSIARGGQERLRIVTSLLRISALQFIWNNQMWYTVTKTRDRRPS